MTATTTLIRNRVRFLNAQIARITRLRNRLNIMTDAGLAVHASLTESIMEIYEELDLLSDLI